MEAHSLARQSFMTRFTIGFILAFCLVTGYAQYETFFFKNEGKVAISQADVESAAQSLINGHGARVAIYVVVTGSEYDFTQRLKADGLENIYGRQSDLLAIYIATEEQYSEIRWGSDFDRLDGGRIRREVLNPSLRDRAFSDALINTLQEVDGDLSNPLVSIAYSLGQFCNTPTVLVIIGLLLFLYFGVKLGATGIDGVDNSSSWSSSNDSSSSWSSSDDSSSSSGGGSDGGSWDD